MGTGGVRVHWMPHHYCRIILNFFTQNFLTDFDASSEVKASQSCPTLCDSMDYSFHGILQARIQEWIAIAFSRAYSQPRDRIHVSGITDGFFIN